MDEETKKYIIEFLTALGQMNHIHTKKYVDDSVMTMKIDVRRKLISDGWKLIEKTKEKK